MARATRTISFLEQQRIEVQAVRIEWQHRHGKNGEIRLTDLKREGLDIPNNARLWLEARTPLGRERKCLGKFGAPNLELGISLHGDFKNSTTVKIYVTSTTRDRQILATVNKPIPLIDNSNQQTTGLIAREYGDGLVGLPFELQFRSEGVVLVLNRDWEECNLMTFTESPGFYSIVSGELIRQIALRVGRLESGLSEDARDAWLRCFEHTYGCSEPPTLEMTSQVDDDSEPTAALEQWAKGVAEKIAFANGFKEMYMQQMRETS